MRNLVGHVFDYPHDGIVGQEETEFFEFCRPVPDDPAAGEGTLSSAPKAVCSRTLATTGWAYSADPARLRSSQPA